MSVLHLISSNNYIVVNKYLINILGLEETIILGELCSEYDYWLKEDKLEDGYFYSTIENIKNNTSLNEYKQRKALKKLEENKIISLKIKGIPAKRFIKINEEQVFKLLDNKFFKNSITSSLNFKELELKNLKGNNNIINNNKNNNKYIYGEFKNVKLTDDEYKKLEERNLLPYIEKLSSYIASKGKRYKSHYATILNWSRKEKKDTELPEWYFNEDTKIQGSEEMENIIKELGE